MVCKSTTIDVAGYVVCTLYELFARFLVSRRSSSCYHFCTESMVRMSIKLLLLDRLYMMNTACTGWTKLICRIGCIKAVRAHDAGSIVNRAIQAHIVDSVLYKKVRVHLPDWLCQGNQSLCCRNYSSPSGMSLCCWIHWVQGNQSSCCQVGSLQGNLSSCFRIGWVKGNVKEIRADVGGSILLVHQCSWCRLDCVQSDKSSFVVLVCQGDNCLNWRIDLVQDD